MLERMEKENIKNVQLLTALKTMPAVIDWLLGGGADIDGFIAPGHGNRSSYHNCKHQFAAFSLCRHIQVGL